MMSAFPALALAITMTYLIGDLYRPFLPQMMTYGVDLVLAGIVFKISNRFLQQLKE